MLKYINIIFDIFLILLSYLVPKKKNSMLMGAGDGTGFKGNPKYFFLYLLKNPGIFSACWITENKELLHRLEVLNFPAVYKYSLKGFIAILRSSILVIEIMPKDITYGGFLSIGRFTFIQTFHGTPLKKIGNDANMDLKGLSRVRLSKKEIINEIVSIFIAKLKLFFLYKGYKLITASSDECRNIYINAFQNHRVVSLGFARNDVFFDRGLLLNDYKKILKLDNIKKIYSFIPTFRDIDTAIDPFPDVFLKNLNTYLIKNKAILLVKKHPYDKSLTISSDYSHICDVSASVDDVMELLAVSDLLITDYSSVLFDFALTGKPIIYYCYDLDDYLRTCRGMYYNYYADLPGPFAKNPDELFKLIKDVEKWRNHKNYPEKYNAFTKRFNKYLDGESSRRLLEYIVENIK